MDVMAVIKKHGINLIENGYDNVKTLKNIAFYNKTGKALSEHLHYRTHEEQYEIGVKLVCRKSGFKDMNKNKMITNNEYIIKTCGDKFIILNEIKGGSFEFKISIASANAFFSYNGCITGHSSQGLTIEEHITVFNIGSPYVSRAWIYVAMSRNRSLDDVSVYVHSDAEINGMKWGANKRYLIEKVSGYKRQDEAKNRATADYISADWFYARMKTN